MDGLLLAVALLVPGALLGVWANELVKRPKLAVRGGGVHGGSVTSGQPSLVTLTVANDPGFIGVRLGKTIVFGWPIHGPIEKGTDVERRSARSVRVAIFEEDTCGPGVPLWMVAEQGDKVEVPAQSVSLANGEYATVYVLGRLPGEHSYSVGVYPDWTGDGLREKRQAANYTEPRSFVVRAWADHVKQVEYKLRVVRSANDQWAAERVTQREQWRHSL